MLQTFINLITIQQRIHATKNALKEADNWTTLTNEIEDTLSDMNPSERGWKTPERQTKRINWVPNIKRSRHT